VVVDDITGAITVWENGGPANGPNGGWLWFPQGQQATGVGKGKGVRFADISTFETELERLWNRLANLECLHRWRWER